MKQSLTEQEIEAQKICNVGKSCQPTGHHFLLEFEIAYEEFRSNQWINGLSKLVTYDTLGSVCILITNNNGLLIVAMTLDKLKATT